jgi:hypothetical protein
MGTKHQGAPPRAFAAIYLLIALYLVLRMSGLLLRNSKDYYPSMDSIEIVKKAQTHVLEASQNLIFVHLDQFSSD